MQLTTGKAPEPGTRLAVVGGEERFAPFSPEAEALLRQLERTAASASVRSQPQAATAAVAPTGSGGGSGIGGDGPSAGGRVSIGATGGAAAGGRGGTARSTASGGSGSTGGGRAAGMDSGDGEVSSGGSRSSLKRGGAGARGDSKAGATRRVTFSDQQQAQHDSDGAGSSHKDGGCGGTASHAAKASASTGAVTAVSGGSAGGAATLQPPAWLSPPATPAAAGASPRHQPAPAGLVSDAWLVDCAAKRELLDPAPYDVRQKQRAAVAATAAAAAALRPGSGGGRRAKRKRQAEYDSSDEQDEVLTGRRSFNSKHSGGGGEAASGSGAGFPGRGSIGCPAAEADGGGAPAAMAAEQGAAAAEYGSRQLTVHATSNRPPPRPWVPPALSPDGSPVVVGREPPPLGWWDPTRGSFVEVPDHLGRPRPRQRQGSGADQKEEGKRVREDELAKLAGREQQPTLAASPAVGKQPAALAVHLPATQQRRQTQLLPVSPPHTQRQELPDTREEWEPAHEPEAAGIEGMGESQPRELHPPSPPPAPASEPRQQPRQRQPQQRRGSPYPPLRIVSYNILGNTACMTTFSGEMKRLPLQNREMAYRGPRLLQELQGYDADVICLQEVDASVFQLWLHPWSEAHGYGSVYLPRGATRPLGPTDPPPPLRFDPSPATGSGGGRGGTSGGAKRRRYTQNPHQRTRRGSETSGRGGVYADDGTGAGGGGSGGGSADGMVRRETDGVALMYRRRRLELLTLQCEELSQNLPSGQEGRREPFWDSLRNRGVVAILALLRLRPGAISAAATTAGTGPSSRSRGLRGTVGEQSHALEADETATDHGMDGFSGAGEGVFMVATTHIWWDPRLPDVKLGEAHQLCSAIASFLRQQGYPQPQDVPLVVCGDWNTRWLVFQGDRYDRVATGGCLAGGVYELLTQGSLGSEHPHHPAARRSTPGAIDLHTSGLHLTSSHFAANGREPAATVCTRHFRACLDYVWLSRGHWAVAATLGMPYMYGRDPRTDAGPTAGSTGGGGGLPWLEAVSAAAATAATAAHGEKSSEDEDTQRRKGGDVPCAAHAGSTEVAPVNAELSLGTVGCPTVWEAPSLPNVDWPSDHWAIGAELLLLS